MMMDGCDGGMALWSLLFVALLIGGLWLLGRAIRGGSSAAGEATNPPSSGARQILEERFARGEIDREEFDERRRALEDR